MRTLVVLLLTALVAPATARAQPARNTAAMTADVKAHWERGLAEHAAGHYQAARASFEACYQLDPRRECLFAWAQAARLSGDCATATTLYRRYLQVAVSAKQSEAAQTQLATCEAVLAKRLPEPTDHEPDIVRDPSAAIVAPHAAPAASAPTASQANPRSPWYMDLWGDVLVGTGGTALAAGTWMYVSSGRDSRSTAPTYDAYADRLDSARRTRTISLVALGAGSLLFTTGVLHMLLRDDTPNTHIGLGVEGAQLGLHAYRSF